MKHPGFVAAQARRELEEAHHWIHDSNPAAAQRWLTGFVAALESLENNPRRCSLADQAAGFACDLRQRVYGRHRSLRALFTLRDETVVALTIRHTARDKVTPDDIEELS